MQTPQTAFLHRIKFLQPALQSYCVAVSYVCVWVQPGSFLSVWVTGRSLETSTHTHAPRRRQWCSWVISAAAPAFDWSENPEMMQQTSPSTYKDGAVPADLPDTHHRPSAASSASRHTGVQLGSCVFFQASRGERPRSAAASVTSRTCLWWKPGSATESKPEAAQNSGANFKPYLLNSLGFQLHFKEQSVCHRLNVSFPFSLTLKNALSTFLCLFYIY